MSAREVIRRAMDKRRSAAHGGCFALEPDPNAPDACCDGTCACARTLDRDADAILAALSAAGLAVLPVEQSDTRAADLARTRALLAGSGEMGGTRHAAASEDRDDA